MSRELRFLCYVVCAPWKYLTDMLNEQDQLRFMRLWTAAQPAVSGFVRALVRDRSVADEVLQETSLVLFRRFDEYDEQRPFVAWALGIAKFQVLSLNRDAARSRVSFDTDLLARFTETRAELAPRASPKRLRFWMSDKIAHTVEVRRRARSLENKARESRTFHGPPIVPPNEIVLVLDRHFVQSRAYDSCGHEFCSTARRGRCIC